MVLVLCSMAVIGAIKGWTVGMWVPLISAAVVALIEESR